MSDSREDGSYATGDQQVSEESEEVPSMQDIDRELALINRERELLKLKRASKVGAAPGIVKSSDKRTT